MGHICQGSSVDLLAAVNQGVAEHHFDKMDLECEYAHVPPETTCLNTSTVGPGLDSDFGASAGTLQSSSAQLSGNLLFSNALLVLVLDSVLNSHFKLSNINY